MADVNVGEVVATAWNNKIGKVNDVIFNASPLFYALKDGGFTKSAAGGAEFEFTLEWSENPNVGFISEFGSIPTDHNSTFDAATYTPKTQAGTVQISYVEELRTAAQSGKFDFVAAKLDNQKNTMIAQLNRALYGDGLAPDTIDGLAKLISATPSVGVVGGVDPGVYPFWRNQQASGAQTTTDFDNLRAAMRSVYAAIETGDPKMAPTYGITDSTSFGGYESILVANERYQKSGSKQQGANGGFDNFGLEFKASTLLYDVDCTAGNLYFVNPKFLNLVYYAGGFLHMHAPVEPGNQLVTSHRISTHAQLCTGNRRRLGVVTAIS